MASRRGSSSAFIEEIGGGRGLRLQERSGKIASNEAHSLLVKHDYHSALSDRAYKRNQVEEAIARIFFPNSEKPPSELRRASSGCLI